MFEAAGKIRMVCLSAPFYTSASKLFHQLIIYLIGQIQRNAIWLYFRNSHTNDSFIKDLSETTFCEETPSCISSPNRKAPPHALIQEPAMYKRTI